MEAKSAYQIDSCLPVHQRRSVVSEEYSTEEIHLNCNDAKSMAPGTSASNKLSRYDTTLTS